MTVTQRCRRCLGTLIWSNKRSTPRLKLQDETADLFEKSILALPEDRKPFDENDSSEARSRLRSAFSQLTDYVEGLACGARRRPQSASKGARNPLLLHVQQPAGARARGTSPRPMPT